MMIILLFLSHLMGNGQDGNEELGSWNCDYQLDKSIWKEEGEDNHMNRSISSFVYSFSLDTDFMVRTYELRSKWYYLFGKPNLDRVDKQR